MEPDRHARHAESIKHDPEFKAIQGLGSGALTFLRHWESIRLGEELVPDVDTWIENLTGALAIHVYRAELQRDDLILLFGGSWLMARMALGRPNESVYNYYPRSKEPALSNLRTMVEQPCGYRLDLKSDDGGEHLQTVILPLRAHGRRPQVVSHVDLLEGAPHYDLENKSVDQQAWIDVGAGTPHDPPRSL